MAVVIDPLAQDDLVLTVRLSAERSGEDTLTSVCATLIDELETESGRATAVILCVDGEAPADQVDLFAASRLVDAPSEDRYLALLAEAEALQALAQTDVPMVAVFERTPGPAEMALALHCGIRALRAGANVRVSLGQAHPAALPACGTWTRLATLLHGPALAALMAGASLDADAAVQAGLVQRIIAVGAPLDSVLAMPNDARRQPEALGNPDIDPASLDLAPARATAALAVIGATGSLPGPMARQIEARELARLVTHPQLVHQRHHWQPQVASSGWSAALAERIEQQFLFEGMALLGDALPADSIEGLAALEGLRQGPLRGLDEMSLKVIDELLHARMHDHDHDHRHGHGRPAGHDARGHADHGHAHGHAGHDHGHGHGHEHAEGNDHGHGTDHAPVALAADAHAPPWMPASAVYVMEKMAHGLHREGRPTGGFYDWPSDDEPQLWPGLAVFARGRPKATPAQAAERLLLISAIQTLRVLAEVPAARSATWDAARPPGLSFPGWAGGPLGWIEWIGRDAFARRCGALAGQFGNRYQLPADWTDLMPGHS